MSAIRVFLYARRSRTCPAILFFQQSPKQDQTASQSKNCGAVSRGWKRFSTGSQCSKGMVQFISSSLETKSIIERQHGDLLCVVMFCAVAPEAWRLLE